MTQEEQIEELMASMKAGDVTKDDGDDHWTAGIDIGNHYNRIEVYGPSEEEATALRDALIAVAGQGVRT